MLLISGVILPFILWGEQKNELSAYANNDAPRRCSITVPAEFWAMSVTLVSVEKNTQSSISELRKGLAHFDEQAAKAGINHWNGDIVLPVVPWAAASSVFLSSEAGHRYCAQAKRTLLIRLEGNTDIFSAAVKGMNFVMGLKLPEGVTCQSGHGWVTVSDPEQYRSQLLKMIGEEVRRRKARCVSRANLPWKISMRQSSCDRWTAARLNFSWITG